MDPDPCLVSHSEKRNKSRLYLLRPEAAIFYFQSPAQRKLLRIFFYLGLGYGSSDPFYVVTYHIKLVTTSWTYSK